MKHLLAINRKALRIQDHVDPRAVAQSQPVHAEGVQADADVVALQGPGPAGPGPKPHIPMGCSIVFSPGWEVDSAGGTAGLCQPVERDIYDCYITCYWPAQVPDHLNNYPDWTSKCAVATKDWRNVDIVFP
jgi:Quinohemoprotein amine dehydrogenase, gamma subunit